MEATIVTPVARGHIDANGARLYYERRGVGPSVLFISGASGDAGHYSAVADLLADEFTTVSYDRRSHSRSPRPVGSNGTTIAEQADDAAGLIEALELAPAAVWGSSGGAIILLELLVRRPDLLRSAIVHEPPTVSVLDYGEQVMKELEAAVAEGMERGGPRAAMELFLRANLGDETFESLAAELRERTLGNGDVFFSTELDVFVGYRPDVEAVAKAGVPVRVMTATENRGVYYHDTSRWVADRLGVELGEVPGAHVPYMRNPETLVEAIRPFLR